MRLRDLSAPGCSNLSEAIVLGSRCSSLPNDLELSLELVQPTIQISAHHRVLSCCLRHLEESLL